MDADFLLTRGPDLVVIGIRLHGFSAAPPSADATPVGTADSDDSRVVLYLPPQHVGEQTTPVTPADDFRAQAELAGPSRIAYFIPRGTPIPLDAAGVLAACTKLAPHTPTPGPFDTAVELPFRLALSPTSRDSLDLVVEHARTPLTSGNSVVGLWVTRVHPASTDREFSLVPVDSNLAAITDPFDVPLTTNSRNQIVGLSPSAPPRGTRLELSSLGGSLEAHGQWTGFRWSHRAALGRDQAVLVQEEGRLYPLGPRAIFTTTVVRDPDTVMPDGSTVHPGGTLGLRVVHDLEILDPVATAPDGQSFGRQFPFSTVEIATKKFRGIGAGEVGYSHIRPTDLSELQATLDSLVGEAAALQEMFASELGVPRTVDDLINLGFEPALRWREIVGQLGPFQDELAILGPQVDELNRLSDALDAAQRALDALSAGTLASEDGSVGPDIAAAAAEVAALAQQISGLGVDFARYGFVSSEVARLSAAADAAFNELSPQLGVPRTVEDLVAAGHEVAGAWVAKQAEIAQLQAQINAEAGVQISFDVFLWPTTLDGQRLQFPVRLRRGEQLVDVTMPLIFVKDFFLPAAGVAPDYASMQDPELADRLDQAWNAPGPVPVADPVDGAAAGPVPAGVVAAHGVLLDVVAAATPKPEDAQVVHALNILGGLVDPFKPGLGRAAEAGRAAQWAMQVDLPAIRTLLGATTSAAAGAIPAIPGVPDVASALGATRVGFAADYLGNGEAAEVLFDVVDDLGVDFTKMADRSGGLAAIQLAADGISRDLGPVQVGGLTSGDPAQMIGSAATLLGFKLQDLVKSLPGPPAIVSELLDGQQPVVRMEWKDVELKDVFALRTYPNDDHPERKSSLSLEVVSSLGHVSTSCDVTEFALVFPSAGSPLVRLDFAALSYRQETTAERAAPPKVDVKGFDIQFLGPLQLLESLRKAADLLGSVPGIAATPAGVTATFNLPIPAVKCGAFSLSNVVFRSAVEVPFGGDPVAVTIGFASRANPFALSVLVFGGGGYVDIRIDANGPRIEASLEFGAMMSVDFVVASGEVHALGGVRYLQQGSSVELTGFVRIGGSVDVLGLVSVSIELVVQLAYDFDGKRLVGRATLVLEIDLTFWSDSFEIDSGEWVLQGGDEPVRDMPLRGPGGRDDPGVLADAGDRGRVFGLPLGEGILDDDDRVFAMVEAPPTDEELAAWQAYRRVFARSTADE